LQNAADKQNGRKRTAFFRAITQRVVAVPYRRCQGSRIQEGISQKEDGRQNNHKNISKIGIIFQNFCIEFDKMFQTREVSIDQSRCTCCNKVIYQKFCINFFL